MAHPPAHPLLTAEGLYDIPDDGRYNDELVDGRLVVCEPPGPAHGRLAVRIGARLLAFVEPRHLGDVLVESGDVLRRGPDTVRGPDVSFLRRHRVPRGDDAEKFGEGTPDLAVDIVSPGDRAGELARKVAGYLAAGTALAWVVYPRKHLVVVHTPAGGKHLVREPGALEGGDLLPLGAGPGAPRQHVGAEQEE